MNMIQVQNAKAFDGYHIAVNPSDHILLCSSLEEIFSSVFFGTSDCDDYLGGSGVQCTIIDSMINSTGPDGQPTAPSLASRIRSKNNAFV